VHPKKLHAAENGLLTGDCWVVRLLSGNPLPASLRRSGIFPPLIVIRKVDSSGVFCTSTALICRFFDK
jgi:hypothetical protein